jgi:hypothetical protein
MTDISVLIFINVMTDCVITYPICQFGIDMLDSSRLFYATVFLTVVSGHLYCMFLGARGDSSYESWPAAKGFLSCIGTNIALMTAVRPKASLIVLYSVVNYRSTLVIFRVL